MNPALLAAIAQAAIPIIQYIMGLPAQERQAAIDALNAAAKTTNAAVVDFVTGSAADLAEAQAKLAEIEAHPDLPAALVPTVVALKAHLDAIAQPLPAPVVVDETVSGR